MESVYLNRPWRWGFGKRGWDLRFRPTKDTVSVASIDELSSGSCSINEERMLARIELMKTRGLNAEGDLTCIATSTYGLSGEGILSYKWSVSGAEFVQETDVTSSTVDVQTVDDKSVRFIVSCEVNNVLQVSDEFRHQRWITNMLVPKKDLMPNDELKPGHKSYPVPVR